MAEEVVEVTEKDLELSGHLQKDYMIFCDYYEYPVKDEIVRGISYYLDRDHDEVMDESEQINDLSHLEEDELKFVKIDIKIFCKQSKINFMDMYSFSRSISNSFFNIVNIQLCNCELCVYCLLNLSGGLKNKKIRSVKIERNFKPCDDRMEKCKKIYLRFNSEKKIKESYKQTPVCCLLKRKIENFVFRDCDLKDNDMKNIFSILAENTHVKTINLFGNSITDEGCKYIADNLRVNKKLIGLSLSLNNNLTDEGIKTVLSGLRKTVIEGLDSLQKFRLKKYRSYYPEEEVKSVDMLPIHPEMMKAFGKKGNKKKNQIPLIPDEKIVSEEYVVEKKSGDRHSKRKGKKSTRYRFTVEGNKTLQYLNLSCLTNITDEALVDFVGSGEVYLKRINFANTTISDGVLEKLGSRMKATMKKTRKLKEKRERERDSQRLSTVSRPLLQTLTFRSNLIKGKTKKSDSY